MTAGIKIAGTSIPAGLSKKKRIALQREDAIRRNGLYKEAHAKALVRQELSSFVAAKEVRLYQVASNFGVAVAEQPSQADIKAMPGGKPATVKGDMAQSRRDRIHRQDLAHGTNQVAYRNAFGRGSGKPADEWHGQEGRKYA